MQDLPNRGGGAMRQGGANSGGGGGPDSSIGPRALETLSTPLLLTHFILKNSDLFFKAYSSFSYPFLTVCV